MGSYKIVIEGSGPLYNGHRESTHWCLHHDANKLATILAAALLGAGHQLTDATIKTGQTSHKLLADALQFPKIMPPPEPTPKPQAEWRGEPAQLAQKPPPESR